MGRIFRALQKALAERGDKTAALPPPPVSVPAGAPPARPRGPRVAESQLPPPVEGASGRPDERLVTFFEVESEQAAEIRALRTKLLAPAGRLAPRAMTVTSGGRGEGKTTVTANLAVAFTEDGTSRVLVVDADVLRPRMHRLLGVRPQKGIVEAFQEELNLEGCIYRTAIPNLCLLPGVEGQDAEGLEIDFSRHGAEFMRRLRSEYDYVFIDTPPAVSSSHAAIIAKHTDGVILIVRCEHTPRMVVQRALQEITNTGGTVIGTVMTHVKHHIPDFVYSWIGTTANRYYDYRAEGRKQGKN